MSGDGGRVTDADLHAYLDKRLDDEQRARVEAQLAVDQDAAARLDAYQAQIAGLHALHDPVLHEPLPARLTEAGLPRRRAVIAWRAAAALALFVAGGAAGWFGNDQLREGPLAQQASLPYDAVVAHRVFQVEVRHPVEVTANEEAHLVAWLSKRLEAPLVAPELRPQGYQLVGGRLLAAGGGPAAQFMYENVDGKRLTLFMRSNADGADTSFRFVGDGDVAGFYWVDNRLGYALVGQLGRTQLLPVARSVYEQLNP